MLSLMLSVMYPMDELQYFGLTSSQLTGLAGRGIVPSLNMTQSPGLPLFHHFHARDDLLARNQRRPIRYDLAHLRTAFAEAGGAGRSVEHQRNQFAGEAVDRLLLLPPHADAELHFGRVFDLRRQIAVAGIDAEELGVDFFEAEAEPFQAL